MTLRYGCSPYSNSEVGQARRAISSMSIAQGLQGRGWNACSQGGQRENCFSQQFVEIFMGHKLPSCSSLPHEVFKIRIRRKHEGNSSSEQQEFLKWRSYEGNDKWFKNKDRCK
eukprot:Gb_04806 [translate_table: standard]